MAGPFKLRSGNAPPFKQMGSSKALQSKIAKEFKLPVSQKVSMPKNFNIKGDPSTTPGFKDTKIAKAAKHKKSFDARQVSKQKGKQFVKGLKKAGKFVGKAGKFVGGKTLGVAGMMMAKSASADQPGTGKHGGTKTGTYNPKTGRYE